MRAAKIAGVIAGGAAALSAFALGAYAAEVTLTPEQTLALFGDTLNGLVRTARNGAQQAITFDYAFPLNSIGYMDLGGGFNADQIYSDSGEPAGRQEVSQYFGNTNGLVYIADSSQWGGADITPYQKYGQSGDSFQLHVPFSVQLNGIGGIRQGICYPTYYSNYNTPQTAYNTCLCSYLSTPNIDTVALKGRTIGGIQNVTNFMLPDYPYYNTSTLDETAVQYFAAYYVNTEQLEENFDIRGITIDCYGVTNASSGTDLWLIVTCPTIWDYVPATTTTAPQTTVSGETGLTGIGTTGTGTDLSGISADLREIILNQRWQIQQFEVINENTRRIANNTATIVNQLNNIYALMVKQGEIPISTDSTMLAAIGSALDNYTTAKIPDDAVSGLTFWGAVASWIYGEYGFAAQMAMFALCIGVTCWILFRGRTS